MDKLIKPLSLIVFKEFVKSLEFTTISVILADLSNVTC